MRSRPSYLLGMDAGGTKTICVLADHRGNVVGLGRSGCGNYQATGRVAAGREIGRAIQFAIRQAGIRPADVAAGFYGISGADREEDFVVIRKILEPVNPAAEMFLENDTMIALRAGTVDGVGLGLISGTGTNAIGFNRQGERLQVGGWGSPYLGDFGSAPDIAATAFRLAQRGQDGRGQPTLLYDKLIRALGVEKLLDICQWDHADTRRHLDVAAYAPLVFEAAHEGDEVANQILEFAGKEVSLAAKAVLRALFQPADPIAVVLGGSVFQRGSHPGMVNALEHEIRREFRNVKFTVLDRDPVIGAVLAATDKCLGQAKGDFEMNLVRSYQEFIASK